MTVAANLTILSGVVESLNEDAIVNQQVSHNGFDLVGLQLPSTAVPATMVSFKEWQLSGGALTIDLTALPGLKDVVQDATGLKVQYLIVRNPAGNNTLTISSANTNGYDIDTETVRGSAVADSHKVIFCGEAFGDVSSTHKKIAVSGTGTQTFQLGLLLG